MHSFAIFKDREVYQKMARILKLGPKESKYMYFRTYVPLYKLPYYQIAKKLYRSLTEK